MSVEIEAERAAQQVSEYVSDCAIEHLEAKFCRAAQHGIAVDRFAREIVGFLKSSCAARSRQLNAKPFGGSPSNLFPISTQVESRPLQPCYQNVLNRV